MPLNLFYTMVQKSQKWPKTQIKGGGGSCLKQKVRTSINMLPLPGVSSFAILQSRHHRRSRTRLTS